MGENNCLCPTSKKTTMKTVFLFILTFACFTVKAQLSWDFTNKVYLIDNLGSVDSVLFGNNANATIGINTGFSEQNIINTSWDSLEIRSIHRTSNSIDCPINYWGNIFGADIDLKIDIRKSEIFLDSSIFFVFKIHGTNFPIEVYSDFSEMFSNSFYNSWTVILKHQYECSYDVKSGCVPGYQHIYTINDSTEKYITVRFDFETSLKELTKNQSNMILNNPIDKSLVLNYDGRIKIYGLNGELLLDRYINKLEKINVEHYKPGMYIIKTAVGNFKIIKK